MRRDQRERVDEQVRRAVALAPDEVAGLTGPDARRVMFDEITREIDDSVRAARDVRRPVRRRMVLAAAATAVVAAAGVGWVTGQRPEPAPQVAAPPGPATAALDRYTASDLNFYTPLRASASASLTTPPATLAEAFAQASATVTARVTAVRPGRTIHDLQFIVVELRVDAVLRGGLRPGAVLVEFPAVFRPDPIEPVITRMRAGMPTNPAVWLLRWEGEPPPTTKPGASPTDPTADPSLYRVLHPTCGVFVQGAEGVIAALAPSDPATDARREAEGLRSLSELAALARR